MNGFHKNISSGVAVNLKKYLYPAGTEAISLPDIYPFVAGMSINSMAL